MLSDEEKKEYEELKSLLYTGTISQYGKRKLIDIIEKHSKEIEELKQIKLKLQEKNIPIETLLAEFERLEDLEDDLTTVYLNGVYDGEKKVEDIIKAKIEEVEQWELYNMKIPRLSTLDERLGAKIGIKYVLQSLLEKE